MFYKKTIFLIGFLLCGIINASNTLDSKQIIQISIPKCGTHLLAKYIEILTNRKKITWLKNIKETFSSLNYYALSMKALDSLTKLPKNNYLITHLLYSDEYAQFLKNPNFVPLFIYRDPRDHVVSLAFFMISHPKVWPDARKMSFDALLLDLIVSGSSLLNERHKHTRTVSDLYKAYFKWLNTENVLAVRFEDLIGEKGGGSTEVQHAILKNIALHMGLSLTDERITQVGSMLFGNTATFREGATGSWKKYFKPEHIQAFKETAGETLIAWGYEKDLNW